MRMGIDQLTEDELLDLNRRVVERLRMLRDLKAHVKMLDFEIGERVAFEPEARDPIIGILIKYNRKSVTVIGESGQHWTVSPGLLKRANASDATRSPTSTKPDTEQLS